MKITSLVENTSTVGMPVEHGLSLYITLDDGQRVLFDMGQRRLFAENAERLGLMIEDIDTAIISHGHYDHGGGLHAFLQINEKAKVYIHKDAFEPHYSLRENGLKYIGLDIDNHNNNRICFCNDIKNIDDQLTLFGGVNGTLFRPMGNRLLFGPEREKNDTFTHEQNLIIKEGEKIVLFAGCAHNGIINIMRKATEVAGKCPTHVLAGMHLVKSDMNEDDENIFIASFAQELMKYTDCKYYTMHCTGTSQFQKLQAIMHDQIKYLSCGESITF